MGIMSCDRNGCGAIMCDRYSSTYGYICHTCFRELIASGPCTIIADFMASRPAFGNLKEAHARYSAVFESI